MRILVAVFAVLGGGPALSLSSSMAAAHPQEDSRAAEPINVRLTVTHDYERRERDDHGSVHVGIGRRAPRGGIDIRGGSSRSTSRGTVQQQLLVMSGGQASIRVAEQVPYSEWFWTWGHSHGLWGPSPGAWTESVGWQEVGASLVVEPVVLRDGRIRVRLTPQFSYFLDRQRRETEVHELSTEVVVVPGEEIDVGGLAVSDREFFERFLIGFDRQGAAQKVAIRLKATAEGASGRF